MVETRKRQGERRPKLQGARRRGSKLRKRPRFRGGLKLEGGLEGRNLEGGEAKVRVDNVRA